MKIKDWRKYQHFKDRRPPWVKLYRDLLDDEEYHALPPASAKVLTLLWLLASEDETMQGLLPPMKKIAFRLRITEKALESAISDLSHWLIQDDISVILNRYQLGPSETEIKTETEDIHLPAMPLAVIQEKWNAIPGVKPCKKIDGALKGKLVRLAKQHPPEWWDGLFREIASSSFLSGRITPRDGRKPFRINLDWATGPINIGKILAGNYTDENQTSSRPLKVAL